MKRPIYKAVLSSEDDMWDFTGFVENPAHSKTTMFFNESKEKQVFDVDSERQIITGVAISVDQPIYRNDITGEYDIVFGKEETRELGRRMLASKNTGNLNINHNQKDIIKSSRLEALWFTDKLQGIEVPTPFRGQNIQDGSMFVSYHIADKQEFQSLKEKNLNGFSIEVFIDVERTKFQKANQKPSINMKNKNKGFFEKVKALFEEESKEFAEAVSVDGLNLKWDGELVEGETVIYITAEGEEDILAPEGMHVISQEEEQLMLTVGADGVLVSMEVVQPEQEMSEVEESVLAMAKQFSAQAKELKEAKATIKAFEKRFANIEAKLDDKKTDSKSFAKTSIGKAIRG